MSKVRIIHKKTGEVKYVSSYVAQQTKQLDAYGYKVEDMSKWDELNQKARFFASIMHHHCIDALSDAFCLVGNYAWCQTCRTTASGYRHAKFNWVFQCDHTLI